MYKVWDTYVNVIFIQFIPPEWLLGIDVITLKWIGQELCEYVSVGELFIWLEQL